MGETRVMSLVLLARRGISSVESVIWNWRLSRKIHIGRPKRDLGSNCSGGAGRSPSLVPGSVGVELEHPILTVHLFPRVATKSVAKRARRDEKKVGLRDYVVGPTN